MQLNALLDIKVFLSIINGRVSATVNRILNRRFKAEGLNITTEQWSVLTCLWEQDKQTQQFICEHTYKDKASITRLLDSLEKNGLVTRESDPRDRRINLIHLTEKGKTLEEVANRIVNESIEMATGNLDKQDIIFTLEILKKILDNIQE